MVDAKKLFLNNTSNWKKRVAQIFVILNLLDCISTFFALKFGLVEVNPLMRYFFNINVFYGFAIKMLVCLFVVFLCKRFNLLILLRIFNVVFVAVVMHNVVNTIMVIFEK